MDDALLALLPVVLMVIFLLFYFCRYARTLEKCFNLKFLNCIRQRNAQNNVNQCQTCSLNSRRFSRRELALFENQLENPADQDEAFILLRGQIIRWVLAESEAMRLAKNMFENNEFAATECITNLRANLFPNMMNAVASQEINETDQQSISRDAITTNYHRKTLESPPSYEDCV